MTKLITFELENKLHRILLLSDLQFAKLITKLIFLLLY